MSKQQLDLAGSEAARKWVDAARAQAFVAGDCDLAEALNLDATATKELRRQALALFEAGKYQRVVDIVLGLVALGEIHPFDAEILARAYAKLGNQPASDECAAHAAALCDAMGIVVAHEEGGR